MKKNWLGLVSTSMVACVIFFNLTVNASVRIYMILKILIFEPKFQVRKRSGQWNYMGEVSRLLIVSPRQGLMEMLSS